MPEQHMERALNPESKARVIGIACPYGLYGSHQVIFRPHDILSPYYIPVLIPHHKEPEKTDMGSVNRGISGIAQMAVHTGCRHSGLFCYKDWVNIKLWKAKQRHSKKICMAEGTTINRWHRCYPCKGCCWCRYRQNLRNLL